MVVINQLSYIMEHKKCLKPPTSYYIYMDVGQNPVPL